MKTFIILLLASHISAQRCVQEREGETICRNFRLGPNSTLTSDTEGLLLKNLTGSIYKIHLAHLANVNEITISDSAIDWIEEGALCSLPNLTSLNIFINSKFPPLTNEVLRNCTNLKNAYIHGLVVRNVFFKNMPNLKSITLFKNVFTCPLSRATFSGLNDIRVLRIRFAKLKCIRSDAFDDLTSLEILDLQNNKIKSLPDGIFKNLGKLTKLHLSDNKLKQIESKSIGLNKLGILFLEENDIENINVDELLTNIPQLERIFLNGNKIKEEDFNVLDRKFKDRNVKVFYADDD